MRFPEYDPDAFPDAEFTLPNAYMQCIAREEGDYRPLFARLPKGDLRRISVGVGQACIINQTAPGSANRILDGLRHEFVEHGSPNIHRKSALLFKLIVMLENAGKPAHLDGNRKDAHGQTIAALAATDDELHGLRSANRTRLSKEGRRGDLVGEKVEYRVQATFSRIRHPWLLSVASLEPISKFPLQ